jgi:hypothetical protein
MVDERDYNEKEWDLLVEDFMKELVEHRIYDNIHRIYARKEREINCQCKNSQLELQVSKYQKLKKCCINLLKSTDNQCRNLSLKSY